MIGIIKILSVNISRGSLLRIYKSFIRPYLDYGDIFYDKPNNESFENKIENFSTNIVALSHLVPANIRAVSIRR